MSIAKPPPTVVLDQTCAALLPAVVEFARPVVFTRREGVLISPKAAADEMHATLRASGTATPYVLVGQSYAAFTQLLFAFHRPELVAGMILVDPSHRLQGETALRRLAQPDVSASEGVEKFRTMLRGFGPAWEQGCREVSVVTQLGDLPLVILEAGALQMPAELNAAVLADLARERHELLLGYAAMSSRGSVRVVPDAGHNIVVDRPSAVVDCVRDLLTTLP
jgi:pimeloyl-ACP methyl ester carboxylesterase